MNLAVVLVSDQTIPNVVYLRNLLEYGERFDKVLLITTEKMEKNNKSESVLKAVSEEFLSSDKHYKIEVKEDMIFDIKTKLKEFMKDKQFDKIFVNITGGTKIMSLTVYDFFKDVKNAIIVYLPIGSTSYKQIKPLGEDGKAIDIPIKHKMSVEEYIKALGITIKSISKPLNIKLSRELFKKYFQHRDTFYQLTHILMNYRKKKGYKKLKESGDLKIIDLLLKKLGLSINDFDFTTKRDWIDYFSGGWFEEYIYSEVLELKNKDCIDDVRTGIKLERKSEDARMPNEFDVMFTKDNTLNIIECKSGDLTGPQLTSTFYKVAYLNSGFGLSANSYLAILGKSIYDKNGKIKSDIAAKSKVFRVKVIDRKTLKEKPLSEVFKCK